ncbi:sigma-70 family RNA polymerase sigma factor [Bacillus gobiensis]|uniref:sigma-70 family RNA polymerase sigma factor n=1 Tax=Bacillus gobiensis TaxID=1441095 RepID=UPI003D1E30E0
MVSKANAYGDVPCCRKEIEEIKNRLPEILENPIIKEFLEIEENEKAFHEIIEGKKKDIEFLDKKFKEFYRYNRIIRYMTGLIKRYSIDYDKRFKVRNNRYQLIIDKPINNGRDDSNVTLGGLLGTINKTPEEYLLDKEDKKELLFQTKNPDLSESLKKLNQKQLEILNLYYEKGYNNKEIGEHFGQTEQNISYWHKKTLKQLRESLLEKKE